MELGEYPRRLRRRQRERRRGLLPQRERGRKLLGQRLDPADSHRCGRLSLQHSPPADEHQPVRGSHSHAGLAAIQRQPGAQPALRGGPHRMHRRQRRHVLCGTERARCEDRDRRAHELERHLPHGFFRGGHSLARRWLYGGDGIRRGGRDPTAPGLPRHPRARLHRQRRGGNEYLACPQQSGAGRQPAHTTPGASGRRAHQQRSALCDLPRALRVFSEHEPERRLLRLRLYAVDPQRRGAGSRRFCR